MNLTLRDKKMSFEKFVELFSEHFKAMREPDKTQEMKRIYKRETGKSVNTKRNRKNPGKV